MALEIVDALVRSGAFDVVVLDSVPGLYSPANNERGVDLDEALQRARLLSEAMRRLAAYIDRTGTAVLFGNRLREGGAETDEEATPGGRVLRFYSSVRLRMSRGKLVQDALGTASATV